MAAQLRAAGIEVKIDRSRIQTAGSPACTTLREPDRIVAAEGPRH